MFCARCGTTNPDDGRFCTKCGAALQGPGGAPTAGAPATGVTQALAGHTETSGKAIGSLICGLMFFFFPIAVIAIVLGHLALSEIRKSAGRLQGQGMAIAGLVLGYAGVAFIPFILIIAAIAIPNLLRARSAANEASAVGSLRAINVAAITYFENYSNGYPPNLEVLDGSGTGDASCDHAHLIEDFTTVQRMPNTDKFTFLVGNQKAGYTFTYVPTAPPNSEQPVLSSEAAKRGCTIAGASGFEVHADPITRETTGVRSFFTDQTGVIRSDPSGTATADSPELR
jgi:type II secretory pathway pseudopilin PulG